MKKPALRYRFHDRHPFNQHRLVLTADLLRCLGALPEEKTFSAESVTERDLLRIHTAEYVETVKQLSASSPHPEHLRKADRFGLSPDGDTPYFRDMHEIAAQVVGGSVAAAERVLSGRCIHALHLGGGLHHAMPGRGAGFCVYNDAAVAMAWIRERSPARILYVDTDVHHGDGVQACFYEDPDVFTFSIHESGQYLFPGTGEVHERGTGKGYGACVNLPVQPFTGDDSWLEVFRDLLAKIADHFKPDIIVSQHGCDAHLFDPLAHLNCSMRIYREMPKMLHRLAHRYCEGKWIALGGGGYDIWRVVPRAWSLLWLEMTDHPLLAEIDRQEEVPLPEDWRNRWQPQSPDPLPSAWMDEKSVREPVPERRDIEIQNRRTADEAASIIV